MKFSEESTQQLRAGIDGVVETGGVPGTTAVVFDKNGDDLFVHSAGKRGARSNEPMTPDSIYWIASCTKMLTALSCMQLVERGQLSLDDSDQLEKLCPELRDVQVLKKDGTLESKRNRITLRMLLTHTAGFGYAFFNERLRDYGYPAGIDEFSGSSHDLKTPLLFHPGEGWEYGVNIDWAGIALERVTGLTLNDYMQDNICKPLGLKNLNMIPTPEMKANLAHMHQRLPSGEVIGRDHLLRRPLIVQTEAEKKDLFCSGGAGMYAKPQEYCRVLAVLLNDGTCPKTGEKLLENATVDEMFKNQIPTSPNSAGKTFQRPNQT